MADANPLEYREESPDDWAVNVAQHWDSVQEDDSTLRLWGDCPTCHHPSETVIEELSSALAVDRTRVPIIVICQCDCEHPQRPDGKRGCGRSGSFTVDLTV
jgi:hypothetical protein